jgi:hypothetical protein
MSFTKNSITALGSFKECVEEIGRMYEKVEHSIDFASLDYAFRGKANNIRDMINNLKDQFAADKKISYRYLFYPLVERLESVIKSIVEGNVDEKTSYAYVKKTVRLPFASFMILDKKYVIIRSPYKEGMDAPYILICDQLLCDMFLNWFDMIWYDENTRQINKDNFECCIAEIKKCEGDAC